MEKKKKKKDTDQSEKNAKVPHENWSSLNDVALQNEMDH